jgi:transcriptional regulator with PAS, ATPase and Fis domain
MKDVWGIQVHDPSGETRRFKLPHWGEGEAEKEAFELAVGRFQEADIPLRDPKIAGPALRIYRRSRRLWFRAAEALEGAVFLADLPVREAELVPEIPLKVGESRLVLSRFREAENLPSFPTSLRPWFTRSSSGKELLWTARKAAETSLSLYIAGETGTGKDVMAQLIHGWSTRRKGPFIPLNCAALPLSLADSELFGHVKGAFTGAHQSRPGALLQAHNGTLFLDEVGDLPLDIQVKLLRFLENGEIRAVGSDHPSKADVRIVCATHKPLLQLVDEGRFRRDLYYRIASISLRIPALRERPEDIRLLSLRFATELGRELSPRALQRIQAHSWPGNVRELRHAIERASGLSGPDQKILNEDGFSFLLEEPLASDLGAETLPGGEAPLLTLSEMEHQMILKALRLSQGNRAEAAKVLGVARSTLFEMLKRHRIPGPRSALTYPTTSLPR